MLDIVVRLQNTSALLHYSNSPPSSPSPRFARCRNEFRNKVDSAEALKEAGYEIFDINNEEGVRKLMKEKKKKNNFYDFDDEDDVEAFENDLEACKEAEADIEVEDWLDDDDLHEEEKEKR